MANNSLSIYKSELWAPPQSPKDKRDFRFTVHCEAKHTYPFLEVDDKLFTVSFDFPTLAAFWPSVDPVLELAEAEVLRNVFLSDVGGDFVTFSLPDGPESCLRVCLILCVWAGLWAGLFGADRTSTVEEGAERILVAGEVLEDFSLLQVR